MTWWRIAKCAWDDARALNAYLADAWEPFAVTDVHDGEHVWLRRPSEREHAGSEPPSGPRLEREAARLVDEINRDMERSGE
jgi:hypothetical protein